MESAVLGALSVQSLYYVKDAKLHELDLGVLADLPRTLARIEARFASLGVQEPTETVAAPLVHRIARADDDGFSSVFGTAFVAETPMVEEDTQPAPTFTRRQVVLG